MSKVKLYAALAAILFPCASVGAQGLVGGTDRAVMIRNVSRSMVAIHQIYVMRVSDYNWGPNLIGPFVAVTPNNGILVTITNGSRDCLFNIRVVFNNQRSQENRAVDLCRHWSWDYYGD